MSRKAMSTVTNRRWLLARRPEGSPKSTDFRFETIEAKMVPGPGEVLVRHRFLSLDPYMRGRMSAANSYSPPIELGSVMVGAALGDVVASEDPALKPGDTVITGGGALPGGGWQDYSMSSGAGLRRIDTRGLPETAFLGPLGISGFTAYVGLKSIGAPQPGETVAVGAATGAVGSMVGQLAKLEGCRTVAIAGGPEKGRFAVETLGYDAAVDHRAPDFAERLAAACHKGIDIYFENVGGDVAAAVRPLLNDFARIPVCGLIAHYNDPEDAGGGLPLAPFMRDILVKRLTVRGYIIADFLALRGEFDAYARPLVASGKLAWKVDIVDGLENAPEAFIGLLEGRNFGKLLVRIV